MFNEPESKKDEQPKKSIISQGMKLLQRLLTNKRHLLKKEKLIGVRGFIRHGLVWRNLDLPCVIFEFH